MNTDRFKDFEPDVRRLVLAFEKGGEEGRLWLDVEDLLVVADYYLEVHDEEGLEAAIRLGEQLYPDNTDIRLRRTHLYGIQGYLSQALRLLKELEKSEPNNTDVCYSLGTLFSAMGKGKESIDYFLKAAADGYDLGMIYGNIGDEYDKLRNTVQAVHYYRKAIAHNPDEERSLYHLSGIWVSQGRYTQSERFFSHHVEEHPYSKVGWYCLGDTYLELDLPEKAVDAFEYALAIDKTYYNAYIHLFYAYNNMGNQTEAIRVLHESLDYADDRSFVLYSIGCVYLETGNYHTASVYFRDAIKEDPAHYGAWRDLGYCSEQMGYLDEAAGYYNRAISLNPDDDYSWLCLADLYINQQRFTEASSLLESARTEAYQGFDFDSRLAFCYFMQGRRNRLFALLREDAQPYGMQLPTLLQSFPEMAQDSDVVSFISQLQP